MGFPSYRQTNIMDCGPCCLQIISKYHKKYYTLETLRQRCGVSREGVSIEDLCNAAETIGLRSLATECSLDQLIQDVPKPVIIFWKESHFVVVYKTTNKLIYISDPAIGLISYTHLEFKEGWIKESINKKGVIIALEPDIDFFEIKGDIGSSRFKTTNFLWTYIKPYSKQSIELLFVALLLVVIQAIFPFITQSVIDIGVKNQDVNFIKVIMLAFLALTIFTAIGSFVKSWLVLHISSRVNIAMLSDYLIKLTRLPLPFFERMLKGDIIQRAKDQERVKEFLLGPAFEIVISFLYLFVFGSILLYYNINLFLIFIIGSMLYTTWAFAFLRIRKRLDIKYYELLGQKNSYWIEFLGSIVDLKLNNYERKKRWKWEEMQVGLFKVDLKMTKINQGQMVGSVLLKNIQNIVLTYVAAKSVIDGNMTLGMMISVQYILGQLNSPINSIVNFVLSAQLTQISLGRIAEINSQTNEEENDTYISQEFYPTDHSINLQMVHFQYSHNTPIVLSGINLRIPHGKKIAIVGDSGSGKSTLMKLILRLYQPSSGNIEIGNSNIKSISLKTFRNKCGVVLQDSQLFKDTILNNIVLNDVDIIQEHLLSAVQIANIEDFINTLPSGYQTIIGESGRGLSEGQKQRILIARAVYKKPEYFFFDEATSALDSQNEQIILDNLRQVYEGKTVIIASHRLSSIIDADEIVVLNKGFIVEKGTHVKLIQNKRLYFNLFKDQLILQNITKPD
jgi:ATP-binding cassette, subfamily B, bacterial